MAPGILKFRRRLALVIFIAAFVSRGLIVHVLMDPFDEIVLSEQRQTSVLSRVCSSNGTWNGSEPTCLSDCGNPKVPPQVTGFSDNRTAAAGEAEPHSWPWQVSLQFSWPPKKQGVGHFCSGSLISQDWVVTAAHCVAGQSNYKAIVGAHDKSSDGQEHEVDTVIKHPDYDNNTYDNDIALIKLKTPVTYNDHVGTVCVPETTDGFSPGIRCVATGWGQTTGKITRVPEKLQQAVLLLVGSDDCQRSYYEKVGGTITDNMICAWDGGSDTCNVDGGGPLVCEKSPGVWALVGVTSWRWGSHCSEYNTRPGVYARVTALRKWLGDTMAAN